MTFIKLFQTFYDLKLAFKILSFKKSSTYFLFSIGIIRCRVSSSILVINLGIKLQQGGDQVSFTRFSCQHEWSNQLVRADVD